MAVTNPMLSIIIPVYNTELYLKDCVESILDQKLTNVEILFINDGSTDNSKNIMVSYQEKYPFIHYLEQENAGQGKARNVGMQQAKGDYIYFMDSDDYLVEDQLRKMFIKVSENNWDAIFFDGVSFADDLPDEALEGFNYKRSKEYGFYTSGEALLHQLSVNNELIISPCLYIVKKEVFAKSGLSFPDDYKHEDEFFTTTLFLYLDEVYHSDDIVFMRRVRASSTMTNTNKKPSFLGYVNVLRLFEKVYTQFAFKTAAGKDAYRKKMKQLTKSAYTSYSQVEDKAQLVTQYRQLNDFACDYNHFDLPTRLYISMTKHPTLLNTYQQLVQTIKGKNKKS